MNDEEKEAIGNHIKETNNMLQEIPDRRNHLLKVLDKQFIEKSLYLHLWEEVIATCIDINTNPAETVVVLKLANEQINLYVEPDQMDLNFLHDMIGNEIAILRTEDCFLLRKIAINQQISKDRFSK